MPENKQPKWTVMVYLAGDNNLTSHCISVLQQLEAVKYVGDDVRVLACFDSNSVAKGSRYVAVNCEPGKRASDLDWEIHNDLVADSETPSYYSDLTGPNIPPPPLHCSDVAGGLKRFLNWAMTDNESEHLMLILYGHGPVVAGKSFLAKEHPPSSLRLEDIQGVLSEHFGPGQRNIDILACHNCAMNGIETAYELKDHVDFMIGSQGLVLAAGWPYEKMISAIVENPDAPPREIARELLKVCARNLLDFVVMDRSSDQSVCDLGVLRNGNMLEAIKNLVGELEDGLGLTENSKKPRYPLIVNAVRVARLEAQSYWGETFVDLYDFCERLLKKCRESDKTIKQIFRQMSLDENCLETKFEDTKLGQRLYKIMECCNQIMWEVEAIVPIKKGERKPQSFYIGSELQYSHGLSIYFPWAAPIAPYFYTETIGDDTRYRLTTAFDTYSKYRFAEATGWPRFLMAFFNATLRNVRRANGKYEQPNSNALGWTYRVDPPSEVFTINLNKSSSDTGTVDYEVWSSVKNYPRRNYLSPSDSPRKVEKPKRLQPGETDFENKDSPPVSYLGWNVCDLLAETIKSKKTVTSEAGAKSNGHLKSGVTEVRAAGDSVTHVIEK